MGGGNEPTNRDMTALRFYPLGDYCYRSLFPFPFRVSFLFMMVVNGVPFVYLDTVFFVQKLSNGWVAYFDLLCADIKVF